jgi:hypothetical protein
MTLMSRVSRYFLVVKRAQGREPKLHLEWRVPNGEVVGESGIDGALKKMYNRKNSAPSEDSSCNNDTLHFCSLEAEADAFMQHKINVKCAIQHELDRQKQDVRKRTESLVPMADLSVNAQRRPTNQHLPIERPAALELLAFPACHVGKRGWEGSSYSQGAGVIRVFFVLTNIRFVETIPGIVGVIRPVARELTCGMYAGIGNDTACVQNVMGRQEVAQMYGRCPEKRARSQLQDEEIYNVYVRCVWGGGGPGANTQS